MSSWSIFARKRAPGSGVSARFDRFPIASGVRETYVEIVPKHNLLISSRPLSVMGAALATESHHSAGPADLKHARGVGRFVAISAWLRRVERVAHFTTGRPYGCR